MFIPTKQYLIPVNFHFWNWTDKLLIFLQETKVKLRNGMQIKKKLLIECQFDSSKFTTRLSRLVQLMWPDSYRSLQLNAKTAESYDSVPVVDRDIESLRGMYSAKCIV